MIKFIYRVTCDNCGHPNERAVQISSVLLVDQDNVQQFFDLSVPAIPDGWVIEQSRKAGQPDKIFCGVGCKMDALK